MQEIPFHATGPPYNCVITMASPSLKSWLRHWPQTKLSQCLSKSWMPTSLCSGKCLFSLTNYQHSLRHCFFIKTNYIVTFLTFFCASTNTIPNARECSFITFLVISKKKIKAGYINLLIHKLLWNNQKNR